MTQPLPHGDDALRRVPDDVLARLAVAGPRYTSYPTVPDWTEPFGAADALAAYGRAAGDPRAALSLYVHLPFCSRLCLYCGCTVEIHGRQDRADRYLDAVAREIALVARTLGDRRRVVQMHWGGGTPTFLSVAQIRRLHGLLDAAFELDPSGEQSIEVDPHVTSAEQIAVLCDLGFRRVSMGVQDFDPTVQHAVRREQTEDETFALVDAARAGGVTGINVDLMYGLPEQTEDGFGRTLASIVRLAPDRLATFGYAHVPWMKPAQKALEKYRMPEAVERTRLFSLALRTLLAAGYEVVGLDHFARQEDSMIAALRAGTLHRNFMGYATRPAEDMVGLGMSAIGDVAGAFIQNARSTASYEASLSADRLPVERGHVRSAEDALRRAVILSLMCRMRIDLDELQDETGRTDLAQHFAAEWHELQVFHDEGFCRLGPRRLDVTPAGRLFLRHMAMVFDAYLRARRGQPSTGDGPRFSKTL